MTSTHPMGGRIAAHRVGVRLRLPTTAGFASLHDHQRLPWRFFGRFTASAEAGLGV